MARRLLPALCAALCVVHALPFLKYPYGARSIAMAGASVSFFGSAEATRHNPAGLAYVQGVDACFEATRAGYSKEDQFAMDLGDGAVVARLLPRMSLGAFSSGFRFGLYGENTWSYDLGLSAGVLVSEWLALGANVKYIGARWPSTESLQQLRVFAVAADGGVMARPKLGPVAVTVGVAARDFGTPYFGRDTSWTWVYPNGFVTAGIGLSLAARDIGIRPFWPRLPEQLFPSEWQESNWGVAVFYDSRWEYYLSSPAHAVGIEVRPMPFFAARAGYVPNGDIWTWGLGLDLRYVRLDFCNDEWAAPVVMSPHYRLTLSVNVGEPLIKGPALLDRACD